MKRLVAVFLLSLLLIGCKEETVANYETLDEFTDNMLVEVDAYETACSPLLVSTYKSTVGGEVRCASFLKAFDTFKNEWEAAAPEHLPEAPEIVSSWENQTIAYRFENGFDYLVQYSEVEAGKLPGLIITIRGHTAR